MKLWHYPHAPYSRKVLVAAREKMLDVESVVIEPFDPESKAKLKARGPSATLPLLEIEGEPDLVGSSLIAEWFDLVSSRGTRLFPVDPMRALRVRAFDAFVDNGLLAPTQYLAWAPRKPAETQNKEKIASMRKTLDHAMKTLDEATTRAPFACGDELTIADLGAACAVSSMLVDKTIPDLSAWPSLAKWYERVTTRPAWREVIAAWAHVPMPAALR